MPQAIGRALIGVSHDKEISKGNATQHTTTPNEKGVKERKNKIKINLSYIKLDGA